MNGTCPVCFSRYPLELAISDRDTRLAIATALQLPGELGPLILRYMGCFTPPKRALNWTRCARLLNELLDDIKAGKIRRHGRDWPAPAAYWQHALEAVLERRDAGKLDLPLTDHAYLHGVICNHADKAEAAEERRREESRTHRTGSSPGPVSVSESLVNDPEYWRRVNRALGIGD